MFTRLRPHRLRFLLAHVPAGSADVLRRYKSQRPLVRLLAIAGLFGPILSGFLLIAATRGRMGYRQEVDTVFDEAAAVR